MNTNAALTLGTSAIRQLDGLYSLNDLHRAAGGESKDEPNRFMRLDQTQALVAEINSPETGGIGNSTEVQSFKTLAGRKGGTYVCRELVYAYAMWISPKFHLAVIRAFDAMYGQPALPAFITPAQQNALQQIVARRAGDSGGLRAYFWSRFNNHFALGSYKQLPAARFDEAIAYLEAMPMKSQTEQRALAAPEFDWKAEIEQSGGDSGVPLPDAIHDAINSRAWTLARDAYELIRSCLFRQVQSRAVIGTPRAAHEGLAMRVIEESTLNRVIAPMHHQRVDSLANMARVHAQLAMKAAEEMESQLRTMEVQS